MKQLSEHLYLIEDTCNVYVVKEGDAALLIDAGSGSVLDYLHEIGCQSVERVLHTHHHRDQCWGDQRLVEQGTAIAVPAYERHLFDQAELFWQTRRTYDNYDDRNNFFSVGENIPVSDTLNDYENFEWHGHRFFVLPAKGHTTGSVALIADIDGRRVVFTGDLIGKGGVLHQLHAVEYAYGDTVGALFTLQSIQALRDCLQGKVVAGHQWTPAPEALLLPSHGEPIDDPLGDIGRLENRIMNLASLGREVRVAGRDSIMEPLFLPDSKMVQVSPHLLWGGSWTCSFFYVVLSETGKALFIDYGHAYAPHMHISADHNGMECMRFVEHHVNELFDKWGVTSLDLAIPTHIHDDHTCGIPHLQKHYGTQCYALDVVAQVLADPARWTSTPCTFHQPIRIDRTLSDRERFTWEEFEFDVYFAPGQTEYHSIVVSEIDGRRVAFSGDNIFPTEQLWGGQIRTTPFQTTVLRNSFQLEMHRHCVEVMREIAPDLLCPGHKGLIEWDQRQFEEYADFVQRKERVFRSLVAEPADHHIDLFWVRMLPYLATVSPGESAEFTLLLRNNLEKKATYSARLLAPPGWGTSSEHESLSLEANQRGEIVLTARAPDLGDEIRRLMTAEILIDGQSQGPIAEALVTVKR